MKNEFITDERIFQELKKAIAETLRVDEDVIRRDSSLVNDLDAESLDFLDINYRLEQVFGIKMARHFVLEHVEEMFGEGSAVNEDGLLTEKAVELLKIRFGDQMPRLEAGMDMDEVPALITIGSLVEGIRDILDALPEKCTHCGAAQWTCEDGLRVKCASCGEYAVYPNGDDLIQEWLKKIQEERSIF